jgi:hypothetical protein
MLASRTQQQHDTGNQSPNDIIMIPTTESLATALDIKVQILLSRPYYRVGGKLVGSILVSIPNDTSQIPIRDTIESLQLSIVGLCRYDPRWYNPSKLDSGATSHSQSLIGLPNDYTLPPHTIPFWTAHTTSIELMNITERTYGKWDDVNPMKPIILPSYQSTTQNINPYISINQNSTNQNDGIFDEKCQLSFTFIANIPAQQHSTSSDSLDSGSSTNDAVQQQPHTFYGTSCRYYYQIVVRLLTVSTALTTPTPEWIQYPVTILPACHNDDNIPIHIGNSNDNNPTPNNLFVMAHSNGLPSRITAIELNQWEGQYTVNRHCGTLYQNLLRGQSMVITDPTTQYNVGILTILGAPNNLYLGCRFTIKIEFPQVQNNSIVGPETVTKTTWIPCYQVSACIQGQEVAITSNNKRTITRRYVWDTAHEMIDPTSTECISLDLIVPDNIPCSIKTKSVEMNVTCVVDIAIGTPKKGTHSIDYRNVHLEIPCQVRPNVHDWESVDMNDEGDNLSSSLYECQNVIRNLYVSAKPLEQHESVDDANHTVLSKVDHYQDSSDTFKYYDANYNNNFDMYDIRHDLKLLSIQMSKLYGLKPKPIGWK